MTKYNFPSNVRLISTERFVTGGNSQDIYANFNLSSYVGDTDINVKSNRALLLKHFNLPSEPKWLEQSNSNICLQATSKRCQGDASITNKKGIICAVLTADCLPVFITNKSGTQVGVVHAGWQGIIAGVIELFVAKFDTDTLIAHFGPAISAQFFQVGDEVYQQFMDKNLLLEQAFTKNQGTIPSYQLDIYQAASIILKELGVSIITGGDKCTYRQQQQYFSFRRDGAKSGRMAHLIWML